jgi:hypothetical protein
VVSPQPDLIDGLINFSIIWQEDAQGSWPVMNISLLAGIMFDIFFYGFLHVSEGVISDLKVHRI